MILDFLDEYKDIFLNSIKFIQGSEKRRFAGELSLKYGYGSISYFSKLFKMSRNTIKKGAREIKSGMKCIDAFNMRGCKKTIEKLPNLPKDIKEIVEIQSQTDPTFESIKEYTRLTIIEIRKQLINKKKYIDKNLPTNQTLNSIVNELGYIMKKVQKTKPKKKIPETDAIFDTLQKIHEQNSSDNSVIRLSIDTKDRVKIGAFSRNGKSRLNIKANDHDFGGEYVVPFGIMDVNTGHVDIAISETKVTADFMIDALESYWIKNKLYGVKKIILNADNGPENKSRRTQFIKRLIEFSVKYNIEIQLAYYPPYHSKYNPIERVWGVLEQHWNGDLLDSKETVVEFAKTMTYKGHNPVVTLVDKVYETGKKLDKPAMAICETALERMEGLEKWFVLICPDRCKKIIHHDFFDKGISEINECVT